MGDFVYLRRRVMASIIQIMAKKEMQYRVKSVHNNGSVLLQGKCV